MKIATKSIDMENASVTFHFANGNKLECRLADLSPEMVQQYALHGVKQKVGDCYAGATENGWSVTDCFNEASSVWGETLNGTWGNSRGRVSGVVEAMAEVFDREFDECFAVWTKLSAKEKRQVSADPKIVKFLAERELAKVKGAKSSLDVTKLFDTK